MCEAITVQRPPLNHFFSYINGDFFHTTPGAGYGELAARLHAGPPLLVLQIDGCSLLD